MIDLIKNLQWGDWAIAGALVLLWGSKLVPANAIATLRGWFTSDPQPPALDINDAAQLIARLRALREELRRQLDLIDQALDADTEVEPA